MEIKIIYGPPGTGKTTTLERIVNRESQEVPLNKIAYVTFSKKATNEIQYRLGQNYGIDVATQMPHCRTIHSMCFREAGIGVGSMMNPQRYRDFGQKAGYELKGYMNADEGFVGTDDDYVNLDQLYRNNKTMGEKMLMDVNSRRFINYVKLYRQYKDTFHFLDFTDLLEQYIAAKKQQLVEVAIVDEAQDLTSLQWQVVLQAFKNVKRLYVAGDDDQAIYTWSGADVDAFMRIKGEGKVLEQSYRLPNNLVMWAKKITDRIRNRVKKAYRGQNRTGTIDYINDPWEVDLTGSSTYLLARNNFALDKWKDVCMEQGVPFSVKGEPFLKPEEKALVRDRKPLKGWKPEKIAYVNRLVDNGRLFDEPTVNISTIHGVKGGEAEHVVLLTDTSRSVLRNQNVDPDSEHRVFYVGVTRAKSKVTVVLPQTRYSYDFLNQGRMR